MAIAVNSRLEIPDAELAWRFSASGGPGGQHANRSNTRVELTWNVVESAVLTDAQRQRIINAHGAEIRVVADERRSQLRNREEAAERLASKVRQSLETQRARRPTKPSKGSKQRRIDAKRRRSDTKRLRGKPTRDD